MKIDFLASQTHWADHLAPVWNALPDAMKGEFYCATRDQGVISYVHTLVPEVRALPSHPSWARYVVIASTSDRAKVNRGHRIIRFEHGAGFSFKGMRPVANHPSYPGGKMQMGVCAFLNPNRYSADRWPEVYPDKPSLIVGVPKMDPWHNAPAKPRDKIPTVALTFHWDCRVCSETRSAFEEFGAPAVQTLAQREDIRLVAHSHPRIAKQFKPLAEDFGIEWLPRIEDCFEQADVLINDASSVLYEFASLDRPVVVMNASYYRRTRTHGLRFWEHSEIGPNANSPEDLSRAIDLALKEDYHDARAAMIADVYPYFGHATERAVEALTDITQ